MLVRGFEEDPKLVERLLAQAPTAKHVQSLRLVRQAEWDLLVTDRCATETEGRFSDVQLSPHLCLLLRAPDPNTFGWGNVESRPTWAKSIEHSGGHISTELRRCKDLPDQVAHLTHEQLEPVLKQRERHQAFGARPATSSIAMSSAAGAADPRQPTPEVEPFIETADGWCLAGRYKRSDVSEAWVLPFDVPDLVPWVQAALAEWHSLAPDRFPGVPDWSHQETWSNAQEQQVRRDLTAVEQAREQALQEFDDKAQRLQDDLREAREAADRYERALLTAQDDELRVAVMRALREFGLSIVDADAEAEAGDDLEDLRASDPDVPNWVALVEVKGYTKGAKTEAIGQFMRFQKRYMAREGRMADAEWYVVNQFLGRDPSTRQTALQGSPGDVAAFAAGGGLVIDTVVLFQLLMDVRAQRRTPQEVRSLLRIATGRLSL